MDDGSIVVDSIEPIRIKDITGELAREVPASTSVADLLETARHGSGRKVYLIRFHYLPPGRVGRTAMEKAALTPFSGTSARRRRGPARRRSNRTEKTFPASSKIAGSRSCCAGPSISPAADGRLGRSGHSYFASGLSNFHRRGRLPRRPVPRQIDGRQHHAPRARRRCP